MTMKYVGPLGSAPNHVATLGQVMQTVTVLTGDEVRPDTTAVVIWVGGDIRPGGMIEGDLWLSKSIIAEPVTTPPTILTFPEIPSLVVGSPSSWSPGRTGDAPITWSVSSGTLPTGWDLDPETGDVTGTPTTAAAYTFTLRAENAYGFDTQPFSVTVSALGTAPVITTTALSNLTVGQAFNQTLAKTGSIPITWGIISGSITGIGINSSTGVLSGTPTVEGVVSITVEAVNAFGSDTQVLSGEVVAAGVGEEFSMWEFGAPTSLNSHDDAGDLAWLGNLYYTGANAEPDYELVGARLFVPAGSSVIGNSVGRISAVTKSGTYTDVDIETLLPNSAFESGPVADLPTLVAGWNRVDFDTPIAVPASRGLAIGYNLGGDYLYNGTAPKGVWDTNPRFIARESLNISPPLNGIYAQESSGDFSRAFYNNNPSEGTWYGLDPIFRKTGGPVPYPGAPAPYIRRSPFRSPGTPGTPAHTISFDTASTGNRLVAVVAAAATISTPTGWTLVQDAIGTAGLYVFTKIAGSGDNEFAVNTSANDYTVIGCVYEFVAASTVPVSASSDGVARDSNQPTLTGMTGTNHIMQIRAIGSMDGWSGVAWGFQFLSGWEDLRMSVVADHHGGGNPGGIQLSVGMWPNQTLSSESTNGDSRVGPDYATDLEQAIALAVKVA